MKEANKGDALSVIEIMEEKGWTKDEMRELVTYLDGRVLELQQPLIDRMDQFEWMFYGGFAMLAILILTCPGALTKGIKYLLALR